jgi:hypothetical protein
MADANLRGPSFNPTLRNPIPAGEVARIQRAWRSVGGATFHPTHNSYYNLKASHWQKDDSQTLFGHEPIATTQNVSPQRASDDESNHDVNYRFALYITGRDRMKPAGEIITQMRAECRRASLVDTANRTPEESALAAIHESFYTKMFRTDDAVKVIVKAAVNETDGSALTEKLTAYATAPSTKPDEIGAIPEFSARGAHL